MKLAALVALTSLLGGCAGSLNEARGPSVRISASAPLSARCQSLDSKHRDWGSVAKGAAVLGGGSGLGTLALDGHEGAQLAVGITGIGAAVVAAIAVYQSEDASSAFVKECSP